MRKQRQEELQFNVLDALRFATLPAPHLAPAIASYLLNNGSGLPTCVENAHRIARIVSTSPGAEGDLADRIIKELQRQVQVKVGRIRRRRNGNDAARLGSQLPIEVRVDRVCQWLFGRPSKWKPARWVSPKLKEASFNWFRRMPDGAVVAGFDGVLVDELVTGFVYREGGPVRFGLLPSQARNIRELLVHLGLHPRLIGGSNVKVDWGRRAFLVSGTDHLPWIYP